jgi:hypothetical protein
MHKSGTKSEATKAGLNPAVLWDEEPSQTALIFAPFRYASHVHETMHRLPSPEFLGFRCDENGTAAALNGAKMRTI